MHIVKTLLFVFLVFSVSGHAQNIPLTKTEAENLKAIISQKAENMVKLSGEFEQKRHLAFMAEDEISSGEFYFVAPDKLKWTYLRPFQYSLVFNGDQIYVLNDGKKSGFNISDNELFAKLSELISGSINGKMLENGDFKSTYFKNGDYLIAKLVPVNPVFTEVLSEIWLFFNPHKYTVHHVKMTTPSRDWLQIEFKNLKINKSMDEPVFDK